MMTKRLLLASLVALSAVPALADIRDEDAVLRVLNPSGAAPDVERHFRMALELEIGNRRVFRSIRGAIGSLEVVVSITGSRRSRGREWNPLSIVPPWIRAEVQVKRGGTVIDQFIVSRRGELMGARGNIEPVLTDAAAEIANRIQTDLR